jgi:enamine deaminase RidA (YjgF/YER057c/UK114 family)
MAIADDLAAQTKQSLKNIEVALRRPIRVRGASYVYHTYCLTAPRSNNAGRFFASIFARFRPAAMMISAGLADPRIKIEIEVTALKGQASFGCCNAIPDALLQIRRLYRLTAALARSSFMFRG